MTLDGFPDLQIHHLPSILFPTQILDYFLPLPNAHTTYSSNFLLQNHFTLLFLPLPEPNKYRTTRFTCLFASHHRNTPPCQFSSLDPNRTLFSSFSNMRTWHNPFTCLCHTLALYSPFPICTNTLLYYSRPSWSSLLYKHTTLPILFPICNLYPIFSFLQICTDDSFLSFSYSTHLHCLLPFLPFPHPYKRSPTLTRPLWLLWSTGTQQTIHSLP